MKERPINFTASMVRAILDGRKTQTRRPYKIRKHPDLACEMAASELAREPQHIVDRASPFGQPGDELWVRETWQHSNWPHGPYDDRCHTFYRADYLDDPHGPDGEKSPEGRYRFWKPLTNMPRSASRITLEVTSVRVERLCEISEEGALKEGCTLLREDAAFYIDSDNTRFYGEDRTAVSAYRSLWEFSSGAGSWHANPWVWVIEFKSKVSLRMR